MEILKKKKPTLGDIATVCGVSKMTVSRVFRNDPNVAESTRQMVLDAAKRQNCMPRTYRSGNVAKSTRQYYVLFHKDFSTKDVYFGEIIRTIQQDLFEHGWNCSSGIIKDTYSDFIKLYNMLQLADADGIFAVGYINASYLNTLLERFVNVVLVDNTGMRGLSRPYGAVSCNNSFGAVLAVTHLLRLGRKRILLIHGPEEHYFWREMIEGYKDALNANEIEFDPSLLLPGHWHIKDGYDAVHRAIESGVQFDAIFANDEMACGAMKAVKEGGLRIPDDVALVGFGGLPMGEVVSPSLTTIAVDREKMGKMAVERFLQLENGDVDGFFEKTSFFPELIVRGSCGGKREDSE